MTFIIITYVVKNEIFCHDFPLKTTCLVTLRCCFSAFSFLPAAQPQADCAPSRQRPNGQRPLEKRRKQKQRK